MRYRTARLAATDVLAACGIPCPADLGSNSVSVRSAPLWLTLLWRGPFEAITLPWGIYVRGSLTPSPELGRIIVHELVHAEQWSQLGRTGFLRRYLSEYLRGRWKGLSHLEAHGAISLEVEARSRAEHQRSDGLTQ